MHLTNLLAPASSFSLRTEVPLSILITRLSAPSKEFGLRINRRGLRFYRRHALPNPFRRDLHITAEDQGDSLILRCQFVLRPFARAYMALWSVFAVTIFLSVVIVFVNHPSVEAFLVLLIGALLLAACAGIIRFYIWIGGEKERQLKDRLISLSSAKPIVECRGFEVIMPRPPDGARKAGTDE